MEISKEFFCHEPETALGIFSKAFFENSTNSWNLVELFYDTFERKISIMDVEK
jgi:hypothetical protein